VLSGSDVPQTGRNGKGENGFAIIIRYLLASFHQLRLFVLLQPRAAEFHLQRTSRRFATLGRRIAGHHEMCEQLRLLEEKVEPIRSIRLLYNTNNKFIFVASLGLNLEQKSRNLRF